MRRLRAATLVFVVGVGTSWGAPKEPAVAPAKKALSTPGYLSTLARKLLKKRMARHGKDMLSLVQSVLLLDHETTARLAAEVAAEPRFTRPMVGGEDDLNAALPERFFVLQDELRSRAQALTEAAKTADDASLARRLGELTQTCVSCHSAYLEPSAPPPNP